MFDADARRAELHAIYDEGDGGNWAPIKEIATDLGISKPDDGWEAAIALIVNAEQTAADNAEPEAPAQEIAQSEPEAPAQADPEASDEESQGTAPADTPWRKVRTDLYGSVIPSPWQS